MLSIKIKKNQTFAYAYCLCTCIYYTMKGWKYNFVIWEILLMIAVGCGILHAAKYLRVLSKWQYLLVFISFIAIIMYRMWLGGDTRLLVSLLAIFIGMTVEFETIAKWIFPCKFVTFFIVFVIGGYVHKNYVAANVGTIIFLMLYLYYSKNKKKSLIMAILLFTFGVITSQSGALIICAGIGIVLYLCLTTKWEQKVLQMRLWSILFPLGMFINWGVAAAYAALGYSASQYGFVKTILPPSLYNKVFLYLSILNKFVSGRINLAAFSLSRFGVSLWGGNIDYTVDTGLPYFLVDSGFILLLQDWGIIMMIAVMGLFFFLMWKLVINREYQLIISAIVIALWTMNEDVFLSVGTNYLFFVIGYQMRDKIWKNGKLGIDKNVKISNSKGF